MRSAATRILEDVDRGILTADRGLYYSCNERIYACSKKKSEVTLTIFVGYLSCTRVIRISLSEVSGMLLTKVS